MSIRRRNCTNTNRMMGIPANPMIGTTIKYFPLNMSKRAIEKAIIIVAIEKKRAKMPMIIFLGKDVRKSSSACRDVRIPKNIITEVEEENSERESATIKH
ncbi:hypothetical protein CIPAW_14G042000 [Carya illinoinensis]|uniref:Uncharacterized protein n=1 Tax=Carya illinoinensis TaxID=32201 RepID=A0A8T1NIY7_CARIL|nr:hypothetical protein CIPAW_14G042000 [Carya illinoinensis]